MSSDSESINPSVFGGYCLSSLLWIEHDCQLSIKSSNPLAHFPIAPFIPLNWPSVLCTASFWEPLRTCHFVLFILHFSIFWSSSNRHQSSRYDNTHLTTIYAHIYYIAIQNRYIEQWNKESDRQTNHRSPVRDSTHLSIGSNPIHKSISNSADFQLQISQRHIFFRFFCSAFGSAPFHSLWSIAAIPIPTSPLDPGLYPYEAYDMIIERERDQIRHQL